MSKSEKLYNKSPSIKKGDDGKPGIHKPSKATGEDIGTEGNPLPSSQDGGEMPIEVKQVVDMHDRHQKEVKSMHDRHGSEQTDMHKRHQTEHKKMSEDHTGGGEINKIEKA